MKRIHIGHHFYGAGNLGDDFALAGFLIALGPLAARAEVTCCTPHSLPPLERRFPKIRWLPYDDGARRAAVQACDVWLGLGGTPFQCSVSRWFAEHLDGERRLCARAGKPMYFLGVGGQDPEAYSLPALVGAALQAEVIWTRDTATASAVERASPGARVRSAADLAHVFFEENPPPRAVKGRVTAALNADGRQWPELNAMLAGLATLPARERVWLAQESRPLAGAERSLLEGLPAGERAGWNLQFADCGIHISDMPWLPLAEVLRRWPSGEWLLSSRYHATLAGAWAGSRAVVVAINDKLRAASRECGYPAVPRDADAAAVASAFESSVPPDPASLARSAAAARAACAEFCAAIGLR